MRRVIVSLVLAVIASGAAAQERTARRSPAQPSAVEDLNSRLLEAHNSARRAVGVPDLNWSPTLAEQAQVWAEALVASGRFEHDVARGAVGENLWTGWGRRFSPEEMVGAWTDEREDYVHGAFPDVRRRDGGPVGHYTQVVWRDTAEVGCALALADANRRAVLACRYSPPGNVIGRTAY